MDMFNPIKGQTLELTPEVRLAAAKEFGVSTQIFADKLEFAPDGVWRYEGLTSKEYKTKIHEEEKEKAKAVLAFKLTWPEEIAKLAKGADGIWRYNGKTEEEEDKARAIQSFGIFRSDQIEKLAKGADGIWRYDGQTEQEYNAVYKNEADNSDDDKNKKWYDRL